MKKSKTFGARVAEIRSQQGLTQPDLAVILKVNREAVSFVETDWSPNPTLRTILIFAKALKVKAGVLIDDLTVPKPRESKTRRTK